MNIYVGNLNHKTTEKRLQDLFSSYGKVFSVKIIKQDYSGRSKGYGFVEIHNQMEAESAIKGLNGFNLDGYTIVVNNAQQNNLGNNYDQNIF